MESQLTTIQLVLRMKSPHRLGCGLENENAQFWTARALAYQVSLLLHFEVLAYQVW